MCYYLLRGLATGLWAALLIIESFFIESLNPKIELLNPKIESLNPKIEKLNPEIESLNLKIESLNPMTYNLEEY